MAATLAATAAAADSLRYCDQTVAASAEQHDKRLRFVAVIKAELERSGTRLALMSRSGIDLSRFGVRYSHAGVSLRASAGAPWSVRQLYYACDQQRPQLYDQGMVGFVLGTHDAGLGYVSALLLPAARALPLERTALDNARALALLGDRYSANAYPFSAIYQNCNQWLAELLALAWQPPPDPAAPSMPLRAAAQQWLLSEGYVPTVFEAGSRLMLWLSGLSPWLHGDDHPEADKAEAIYRVSMPAAIEAFVQRLVPDADRI